MFKHDESVKESFYSEVLHAFLILLAWQDEGSGLGEGVNKRRVGSQYIIEEPDNDYTVHCKSNPERAVLLFQTLSQ